MTPREQAFQSVYSHKDNRHTNEQACRMYYNSGHDKGVASERKRIMEILEMCSMPIDIVTWKELFPDWTGHCGEEGCCGPETKS